ncbi:hypothetical protein [Streptomyces sp. NBC_01353]|uniref:hypothetical protein n=1 Tax=Streptomyces sp. NBC_01353 TaxID=2903835 RepID=UPI002E31D6D7|nr:hypothetical protein [Streptomyces sp. NBC_01353]
MPVPPVRGVRTESSPRSARFRALHVRTALTYAPSPRRDGEATAKFDVDQDESYKLVIDVATGDLEDVTLIARRLRGLHEAT